MSTPLNKSLKADLSAILEPTFPGIGLKFGHSRKWNRPQLTVTWKGFEGLLPEERFHRLMQVIPESFYNERLRGMVWFELAPGETMTQFMELPRSEDIEADSRAIFDQLRELKFFTRLATAMGSDPEAACGGGLDQTRALLRKSGLDEEGVQRGCLLMLLVHAYCDCAVVLRGQDLLEDRFPRRGRKPTKRKERT